MKNLLLGYDVGSSSIKAALLNADSGELIASSFSPKSEMKIDSPKSGWAEQSPETWWKHIVAATKKVLTNVDDYDYMINGIGISYQMHGLVVVDKDHSVLHPSIIWCDSRAVEIGKRAAEKIGLDECLNSYLNLPGNFTASKLLWLKENEPDIYSRVYKFMLPGDFIAMKLTGKITTTISGLSECILWNFNKKEPAYELLDELELDKDLIPQIVPTFGIQGYVTQKAAGELGIKPGIPVAYRAGDQPNNALSLNVLREGEAAATAGTSGVIYGVTKNKFIDKQSRVNSFAHVNYSNEESYTGVLLCINGTAIFYRWLRTEIFQSNYTYEDMNKMCSEVPVGSDGLFIFPFGNGAERSLENKNINCNLIGIDFNKHTTNHIIRSGLEGIAFAFRYGLEILIETGMEINIIKVGNANLFLSEEFAQMFTDICNADVLLYNTDGAQGAARGAGIGTGFYKSFEEASGKLKLLNKFHVDSNAAKQYNKIYQVWKSHLIQLMKS